MDAECAKHPDWVERAAGEKRSNAMHLGVSYRPKNRHVPAAGVIAEHTKCGTDLFAPPVLKEARSSRAPIAHLPCLKST